MPTDADLSQLYEAIQHLIQAGLATIVIPVIPPFPPFPALPVIPNAGEGLERDGSGAYALNYPGLGEETILAPGDLMSFFQSVDEGGQPLGHHRRINFATFSSAVLAQAVSTGLGASSTARFTRITAQPIANSVVTNGLVAGPAMSFCSAADANGLVTITENGIYTIDVQSFQEINIAAQPDNTQLMSFEAFIYINGGAYASTGGGSYANFYYTSLTLNISTTTYLAAGQTVALYSLVGNGNYYPTRYANILSQNLYITKVG